MIWTERYKPKKLKEVVGNRDTLSELSRFVLDYKNQRKRAIILHGSTGTGKTCSIHAIAKENDLEIMELNASDFRKKDQINEVIGNSIGQQSLFHKGKIILIDEIDGLSGMKDRGGAQAVASLLEKSVFPIVLTANDISLSKLSGLRKKSILLEFEDLETNDVLNVLKKINDIENLKVEENILKRISNRSSGDLRGAINDLQSISILKKVEDEDVEDIGDRRKEKEISSLLRLIFKSKELKLISETNDLVDVNFDEMMMWIDENLPLEYSGKDLERAYDSLSKADVFKGRIRRWQYWRFLVYQKFFMNEGVALAKRESKKGFVNYQRSKRILEYWKAKMKYGKRNSICEKLAKKLHISTKRAMQDVFPYVRNLLTENKYVKQFELEDDEVEWLKK